jgi:hypothetical protein
MSCGLACVVLLHTTTHSTTVTRSGLEPCDMGNVCVSVTPAMHPGADSRPACLACCTANGTAALTFAFVWSLFNLCVLFLC